ncbi:hypothetical protein PTTG_11880 [Puccinia triticina 1-1 BBBD Race 1]|uniref:Uncharacterized protein n=1 Tax=Puccinia triticina (isolate 1-1 / race 1 (BBBD)) TaxID=630390 RepID=A0A180G7T4_PUCT1|nr:hypothetical protein PTTG_11880 [Puccinia triticina 1-1 BBBD Race 1]
MTAGTTQQLRLNLSFPLQSLKQPKTLHIRKTCLPDRGAHCQPTRSLASRNYSVAGIYPSTPSLSLERDSAADGRLANQSEPRCSEESDLAHDKVENWNSRAHAHLPFRPDFTLFEPLEPADDPSQANANDHTVLHLKSRVDTSLAERLVYLIRDDPDAAEQLRTEIIKSGINLSSNLKITSHCFDLLFQAQDIASYLEWLPLVASSHLQQTSSLDIRPPISISEVHLNYILKSSPNELSSILKFLEILVAKECYSRHIAFTVIRHLVRTQTPATTISATEKICSIIKSSDELIKSSYDFLVVQLANQGHLSEALEILYTPHQQSDSREGSGSTNAYPLTYQALADQMVSRIKDKSHQTSQNWSGELDRLISRWREVHKPSLNAWLAKKSQTHNSLNLQPLTKQISKKYVKVFQNAIGVKPEICHQISLEKLDHFTSYFRSLFDQNNHPKFVKAAQLANEIHQFLPLRNSFQDILETLQPHQVAQHEGTEEQILKSFVLNPPVRLGDKPGQPKISAALLCPKFAFEARSDIVFLWAHSWMIFYHRSGQPRRAIQIFLDYFIPVGCDVKLLDQIRWGPNGDGSPSRTRSNEFRSSTDPTRHQTYHKLIHPTVGVLTVLYDSLLSICPPKLIPIVFHSFLTQHFHQPSAPSSATHPKLNKRLEPNLGSFRPFVRACLKAKDVDGALNVLEYMHTHLGQLADVKTGRIQDEGGWIDLLEWCAIHSAGPKPKAFDPSYQWGDQRKRKINGWDGKMKEELVYAVLQKFFFLKAHSMPQPPVHSDPPRRVFLEQSPSGRALSHPNPSNIRHSIQGSRIFTGKKNALIQSKLTFLDHSSPASSTLISAQFPSLKLISKLKFAFFLAKNSNGSKMTNQLLLAYK